MKYIVNKPLKLIDQFHFYKDKTPWEGKYKKVVKTNKNDKKSIYHYLTEYPKKEYDFTSWHLATR